MIVNVINYKFSLKNVVIVNCEKHWIYPTPLSNHVKKKKKTKRNGSRLLTIFLTCNLFLLFVIMCVYIDFIEISIIMHVAQAGYFYCNH